MPFPTARYALSHVGATGRQRSSRTACADAQVGGLLRGSQYRGGHTSDTVRAEVQRRILPTLPGATAQASRSRQTLGTAPGQHPIPPRPISQALAGPAPQAANVTVLASVQPRSEPDRTRVKADAPLGDAQSALSDAGRYYERRNGALPVLETAKPTVNQTMRHYLRRYV